ncbi:MAG: glutamate--tRNA ligase [Phycisphaerales bacterium]|nr:glutamate--tRNA ligase [Phycisphaerales bacterium]
MTTQDTTAADIGTRFAPSPSGDLHVGGARTALFCWAFARGHAGRFVLRIEDTDRKRSSGAAALGFLEDLIWLGIDWDEGPELDGGVRGPHGPYFQSQRLELYQAHMQRLLDQDLAYHAFDTPEELDAKRRAAREEKKAYRYDRAGLEVPREERFARAEAGEPHVVRFRTPDRPIVITDGVLGEATLPAGEVDDFVIRKADGYPTYHFAVVVDDALMECTHVLRAQEHFNNTAKHLLLQEALEFPHPTYGHLSLIMNPDGSKMSKRDKDKAVRAAVKGAGLDAPPEGIIDAEVFSNWQADKKSQLDNDDLLALAGALDVVLPEINVRDFRRSGYLPEVLCNFLALNGWSPGNDLEKFDNAFLCEHFDLSRVQKTPARFDRDKLLAFNLDAIQSMSPEEFRDKVRAHGEAYHPDFVARLTDDQFDLLANASHERSKTLDELYRGNQWLMTPDEAVTWPVTKAVRKAMLKGEPCGLELLEAIAPVLEAADSFDAEALQALVNEWAEAHCEGNLGKIAQPLRIAATGGTVSPPIFDTLAILGRDAFRTRMRRCIDSMKASMGEGAA